MRIRLLGLCVSIGLLVATAGSAATITVNAGGNLQAALDAAQPGDTVVLQAGAKFTGTFTLPAKGGSSDITVRSSTPDGSLPPAGTRITPAAAPLLPKIVATKNGPALRTAAGATHWRLLFLEFLPDGTTASANLVELGSATSSQSTLSAVPQHLTIDRCYLHGDPAGGQRRGVALNSGDTQILDSYFADFKAVNQDTQAIAGWNGPGPFVIADNYLEAAGENILFGGSDPKIPDLVPGHITISGNVITKPVAWMSQSWTVKNLLEFKNAENVTVEGNTIEHNWAAGQSGYSILFTPRNQGGTAPWTVVKDITVENNVIRHVAAAFNISGYDNLAVSQQTSGIAVRNNLMYDVSTSWSIPNHPANGWVAVIGAGPKDIVFDHNTADNDGTSIIQFYAGSAPTGTEIYGFVLTNNLLRDNKYGIFGANSSPGTPSLTMYAPDADVRANAFAGASAKQYPSGNDFPTIAQWLADFVDVAAADYRLVPTSLSKNAGTDGKDLGVDFAALDAALTAGSDPAPDPTPSPSGSLPYTGTPAAIPGRIEAENYDTGGEGIAYRDTTAGNSGGAYRNDDVDIRVTSDGSGAYNLKSVRGGEWLNYTVNVASTGSYTLSLRVASYGPGGTAHLDIDGSNVTGPLALPDTGGWNTWTTFSRTGVSLPAGTHVLRLAIDANGSGGTAADINWIALASASSAPYVSVTLPGTIEAENYDTGGEGVAYHDTTPGNSGGVYRADNVDLQSASDTGGGYKVKTAVAGEWLNYTAPVGQAGTYAIDVRVTCAGGGGAFHIEVDGTDVTGALQVPDTGGWQAWQTISRTGVALSAGAHVFRLVLDTNGSSGLTGNFNWIRIR